MKATGVVRRIDDLGRVVIPKEIRKTLRIREGDSLEIFVNNIGDVILKKYSPIANLSEFAQQYSDAIYTNMRKSVIIFDKERIVASSGKLKSKSENKKISTDLQGIIENGKNISEDMSKKIEVCDRLLLEEGFIYIPIRASGDCVGGIIVANDSKVSFNNDAELLMVQTAATFFGKYLED